MNTTVAVQWITSVQCGSHICVEMYVKYVYCTYCCIVHSSDIICNTDVNMFSIYIHQILAWMAYLPNMGGLFISSTYLALTCEVYIAVGCVLVHVYRSICSICPCSIFDVWHICSMAVIFLLWYIPNMCTDICSVIYAKYVNSDTESSQLAMILGERPSTVTGGSAGQSSFKLDYIYLGLDIGLWCSKVILGRLSWNDRPFDCNTGERHWTKLLFRSSWAEVLQVSRVILRPGQTSSIC